ncbi:MAG TPA: M1 family metallopeptidase [Chthoniobacterales bacterium]|jgi:aminopeptidase N|nr:M1 family metallopeptidase [Chthoniobacterales bacterium]
MRKSIALLLLGFAASLSHAENKGIPAKLSKDIVPEHYLIHLEPNVEQLATEGVESIEIRVLNPVNRIVLNAVEIEISAARIAHDGIQEELIPQFDAAQQTVFFATREVLEPGKYTLTFNFKSRIFDVPHGLFVESDQTEGNTEHILATCMEPADARRVFPCWDEPAFRATYQISIRTRKEYTAASNTPIFAEQALGQNEKIVVFEPTPPICSYLVFVACGRFQWLEDDIKGIKLRILTTEGKKEFGRYAMEVTKQVLPYFSDYCAIPHELAKLDQIALPGSVVRATENWGGITYSEEMLLYDPANNSDSARERVFSVVAHELAHLWFGNLVAIARWDDIWLNEGFASWMQMKATEHFHPEWEPWLHAAGERELVMAADSKKETHPIRQGVDDETKAAGAFDSVVYQKGQFLLRMLEAFFGEDAFRSGVQAYLRAHQFSSATTADFWEALEKSTGKPAGKIFANWVEEPGFPLIRTTTQCLDGKSVISLEQVRFAIGVQDEAPIQWSIPVGIFSTANPQDLKYALLERISNNFDFPGCDGVIKANADAVGFFRVLYEPALFIDLQRNIAKLPEGDRINLLTDTWALVESGSMEASAYFELLENLIRDDGFALWKAALGSDAAMGGLKIIDRLEQGQPGRENYQKYLCAVLGPKLQALGWDEKADEDTETRQMRAMLIETLGFFGNRDVIDEAFKRFEMYRQNAAALPPNLRAPVLLIVGRYSSDSTYDQLLSMIPQASTLEEKGVLLRALSAPLDPGLVRKTLTTYLLSDSEPPAAAARVFESVATQGEHPEITWDFATSHLQEMQRRLGTVRCNRMIAACSSAFADEPRANDVIDFFKNNLSQDAIQLAEKAAEIIRFRAKLKAKELPVIDKWIETKSGAVTPRRETPPGARGAGSFSEIKGKFSSY